MTYSKVEPGKTATVTIGGTGRPVVGRIAMPEDARTRATGGWTFGHLSLSSDWLPLPPYPQDRMEMEEEWWLQQRATLQKRLEEMPTPYQVATFQPQPDYSFRIDDVPAGTYMLTVQIYGPASSGQPDMIGVVHRTIEVPATPDGPSDEPLDLGELPLSVGKKANPGELAPSLEVTDVWGKPLRLEDYRGKHLVLVLQWPAMGKKGMEQVKTLYAAVGESEQAAMVSIYCMDRPPVNVKEFLEARQMTWPQAFMDRMEHSAILSSYGFESPATLVLIDPQGRIVAKDLRGKAIEEAVGKAVTAGR
jgi:peroxiredoxin